MEQFLENILIGVRQWINSSKGYVYNESDGSFKTKYLNNTETNLNTATGSGSFAEGFNTNASGSASHAEGGSTIASIDYSHAEGYNTYTTSTSYTSNTRTAASITGGTCTHAEGNASIASGHAAHAEGYKTLANGSSSHAEGYWTKASGNYSHTEGNASIASGYGSHAEGNSTTASGSGSHAEGQSTTASTNNSHTEGYNTYTTSTNYTSNTRTATSIDRGTCTHAEGNASIASGHAAHAEGYKTLANENYSHAEGHTTKAFGAYSHTEGYNTTASGSSAHTEGYNTTASGSSAHAEGSGTTASAFCSHTEGNNTTASSSSAHAEGNNTTASSISAHAEGDSTTASEDYSHAEGWCTYSRGYGSHTEGVSMRMFGTEEIIELNVRLLTSSERDVIYDNTGKWYSYIDEDDNVPDGCFNIVLYTDEQFENAVGTITDSKYISYDDISGDVFNTDYPIDGGTYYIGFDFDDDSYIVEATGPASHAEGIDTHATNMCSHAEGNSTIASGNGSHAEGEWTTASGGYSHTEGVLTEAIGSASHAEGQNTRTVGNNSHSEGGGLATSIGSVTTVVSSTKYTLSGITVTIDGSRYTLQVGDIVNYSSAYAKVTAISDNTITVDHTLSAALGNPISIIKGVSYGERSHIEGYLTTAIENQDHAEGYLSIASGISSHAEGNSTTASGRGSHAEGLGTKALNKAEHAEGKYNKSNTIQSIEFVDFGLPSGTLWYKYNLGVNPNQLSNAENWYGNYYAWGEIEEKAGWDGQGTKIPYNWTNYEYANGSDSTLTKYCNHSGYGNNGYTDELTILESEDDIATVTNSTWRMPTEGEIRELLVGTSNIPVEDYNDIEGLNGRVFMKATITRPAFKNITLYSPITEGEVPDEVWQDFSELTLEELNALVDDDIRTMLFKDAEMTIPAVYDTDYGFVLKQTDPSISMFIPAAGTRDGSNIIGVGSECGLWTSSLDLDTPSYAYYFGFDSDITGMSNCRRYQGLTVRPVLDAFQKQTIHSIGIGHNNEDRKNAFEVMQNGDAYLLGVGNYDGVHIKGETGAPSGLQTLQEVVTSTTSSINGLQTVIVEKQDKTIIIDNTTGSTVSLAIEPNKMYMFGEKTSITITELTAGTSGIVNEYMFQFTSGSSTATTLTVPATVVWLKEPNIQTGKKYAVSIENNLGIIGEWDNE